MRRLLTFLGGLAAFVVCAVPASAAPVPVTYLNANFGPPNDSGIAFYRSSGSLRLQSATASVSAKAKNSQVEFSASASNDPNETSSGFSSYDIGTVNAGPGSFMGTSVSPRTLLLSGSAHFAMNLWFDSDHNGEYFVWNQNQFAGLGGTSTRSARPEPAPSRLIRRRPCSCPRTAIPGSTSRRSPSSTQAAA